ncbi:MAG: hypothetical protein BWY99_02309 [Synergistetes bacterium ADurb.BinA166]|nr:MAG: hypothetical protein BWY99_02309 [Synergistetes bacterium ADurb.BinA166]
MCSLSTLRRILFSKASTSLQFTALRSSRTNSSPPKRDAICPPSSARSSALATRIRAASPAGCPWLSLMLFSPFRSTNTTAKERLPAPRCGRSSSRLRSNVLRFGRPVSPSKSASLSMYCLALSITAMLIPKLQVIRFHSTAAR